MLGFHAVAGAPVAAANTTLFSGLLASTGTYTLSGKAVTLLLVRKVTAEVGVYTLTGKDVDFIVSLSQASLERIFLIASSAVLITGYKMITNFRMTAGDSKTLVVNVKDVEGNAVNILGSTIKWRASKSLTKAAAISKSTTSGISISDGANGEFTVTLDPADTLSLSGMYYHEAEVTSSDSSVSTVLTGTLKIDPALIST